ncbi:MAG: metal ABC transporter permease [Candidatus Sumerlaeia bacterium]
MTEFVRTILDPDIPFLRYALLMGLLASIPFGVVGSYVVARRISYLAGAIAHSVLGGIGAALYFQNAWDLPWLRPMYGALVAALVAALIMGLVSRYASEREDTAIGALWAIGMATGLIFISKTSGYIDPMTYLFGNILILTRTDLWLVLGLDVVVISLALYYYHALQAVCFDEEYARLRGLKVDFYYFLLMALTAMTVVLMVGIVGIVMVVALLTLPAAVGGMLSRRLWQMMLVATLACACFMTAGLQVSFTRDLPTGPTIILVAGAVYLLVILLRFLWGLRRKS